jgi:hypothetical protein
MRIRKIIVILEKQWVLYSECVFVTVVIQHVKRMSRVVLSSVASLGSSCFFTSSFKRHDFRGKLTEHKIYFDFLYIFCLKHHSKKIWARYDHSLYFYSRRVPGIFVRFLWKLNFLEIINKYSVPNFMKILPVGAEPSCSMRTDGQIDLLRR